MLPVDEFAPHFSITVGITMASSNAVITQGWRYHEFLPISLYCVPIQLTPAFNAMWWKWWPFAFKHARSRAYQKSTASSIVTLWGWLSRQPQLHVVTGANTQPSIQVWTEAGVQFSRGLGQRRKLLKWGSVQDGAPAAQRLSCILSALYDFPVTLWNNLCT